MLPVTTLVILSAISGTSDAVLLQFASENCAPCRAMQPAVSRLVTDGYPIQRIDVDRHPEVARQFNVTGVPSFILLVGGKEVGRVAGATSYDRLVQMFQSSAAQTSAVAAASAALPAATAPGRLQLTDFRGQAGAAQVGSPDQAAMAATVRLKVEDATGFGYGTGTIIDVHDDEALVVTCGHLFRESQGKGRISVDLFAPGAAQPVEGQLISYDLDRDIALVSIRPGMAIAPVMVAPPGYTVRIRDEAFTIGCDKGAAATVRPTEITSVNKYQGKPRYTAAGQPVDGRSGGGLFTAEGLLIGICNAADPADDEGLYAALASIHWQLDQIGQPEVYQRAARMHQPAAGETAQPSLAQASSEASLPQLPASMPAELPAGHSNGLSSIPRPNQIPANAIEPKELALLDAPPGGIAPQDAEVVFIIRSKSNPQERSEVYVVDQASPELLTNIVHAARQGAGQRAASVAARPAPAGATMPAGYAQPVVRGQSGE